ncbi:AraC family transcriptional regulator [Rhodobacteraceae bacterium 63075]|nr:AraC family transcriptional regulator [Rhodobacteraceae bacterium 63075]
MHNTLLELGIRYEEAARDGAKLPGVTLYRRDTVSRLEAQLYEPVLCLILQGGKVTQVGKHRVELRAGDALVVSHDLPVMSRITHASASEPYLALILALDMALIRSLYDEIAEAALPGAQAKPLAAGPADPGWTAPLIRYLALMDDPLDAKVLGPPLQREIHYRLLRSPLGGMLRANLVANSHASRIARAIARLRADFRAPLSVAELARSAAMSASSFHSHFKTVTGTSPLQYQKELRLIEAQALLSRKARSVSDTAFAVGYESPTQFSREYARKFGHPPSHDQHREVV